jgi:hypothetical protein
MNRKNLDRVQADLSALAEGLPSQHVEARTPRARPRRDAPREEVLQFSLSLRRTLRKELARLAADADMTMRAFVLLALRDKGLSVTDEDLLDLRKQGRSG